jgi:tetratricopeptide (TPR) repeat protein
VRTAFSCSYRWLSTAAARLFRLLGLHQGPDVSAAAAASLAGLARWEIRPVLRELADVSLIVEHLPGRFVMHDLLRAYAAEQSADSEGSAALGRLLDHYLRTGYAAARILYQHRETIPLPPGQPGVVPEELNGYDEALAWFEIERQGLEAAIATASATGFDLHAWQIAWTLVDFLHWRGYWHNIIITQNIALTSARRLRESAGEALVHRSLARAYCELGELGNAGVHLRQALELYRELKDPVGQGLVHMGLGLVLDREERYAEALDHARQSLKLHQEFNNQVGQADALNAISWCLVKLHKYEQAIHYSKQALALHELLANRIGAAHTWDTLGYACHHTGDYATAASCYRSALELFRAIGNEHYMAIALTHLGETYREANDVAAARAAWEQALSIVPGLDHAAATEIQVKLDNLVHASLRFFMIANG